MKMSLDLLDSAAYAALRQDIARLLEIERSAQKREAEQEKVRNYWAVGRRLAQVLPEQQRAGYGRQVLARLAQDVDIRERLLYEMVQFFRAFPMLPTSAILGWSHFRTLLRVADPQARTHYLEETLRAGWSVRRLEIQIQEGLIAQQQAPASRALVPRRGQLYTYRLLPSTSRPRLDLGFGIYHAASFPGVEAAPSGRIVEAIQTEPLYRLQPSPAGTSALYTYQAVVERVVDGDTLWVEIDCGFDIWVRQKLRLRGIDTPELAQEEGRQVQEQVEQTLNAAPRVVLSTYRPDKYGRYLADLFYLEGAQSAGQILQDGHVLNGQLLEQGQAVRFA